MAYNFIITVDGIRLVSEKCRTDGELRAMRKRWAFLVREEGVKFSVTQAYAVHFRAVREERAYDNLGDGCLGCGGEGGSWVTVCPASCWVKAARADYRRRYGRVIKW